MEREGGRGWGEGRKVPGRKGKEDQRGSGIT